MESIVAIGIAAFIGGMVQGITGFGAGIVMMMILPHFFSMPVAAGVSTVICVGLNIQMVVMYRKYINFSLILRPTLICLAIASVVIFFSTSVDSFVAKKILGAFFIMLCVYYLFIKKDSSHGHPLSILAGLGCMLVSALGDGLFGIGGPLMVVYFMAATNDHQVYLGTLTSFFLVAGLYYSAFRIATGILTVKIIPVAIVGLAFIFIGGFIAKRLVCVLDHNVIERLVHITLGIAGVINLI